MWQIFFVDHRASDLYYFACLLITDLDLQKEKQGARSSSCVHGVLIPDQNGRKAFCRAWSWIWWADLATSSLQSNSSMGHVTQLLLQYKHNLPHPIALQALALAVGLV